MAVEEVLFEIADALRVPVLVLALASLALVLFELGGMAAELLRRRRRGVQRLDLALAEAGGALSAGDAGKAKLALSGIAANARMREVFGSIVDHRSVTGGTDRIAKDLAEFDYASIRRLERTRILVRVGPALGLMGTLIPLSPALAGLAAGDVETLSENLRVAFSVTVAGLMVGAIAFGISLVRDRLYGQDFSDVEYVASKLAPGVALTPAPATAAAPSVPGAASPAPAPVARPAAPTPAAPAPSAAPPGPAPPSPAPSPSPAPAEPSPAAPSPPTPSAPPPSPPTPPASAPSAPSAPSPSPSAPPQPPTPAPPAPAESPAPPSPPSPAESPAPASSPSPTESPSSPSPPAESPASPSPSPESPRPESPPPPSPESPPPSTPSSS
jgi:biopolymer transport protein ExbB/TolQ